MVVVGASFSGKQHRTVTLAAEFCKTLTGFGARLMIAQHSGLLLFTGAGEEIARQIANVALHVYHSARAWDKPQNELQTRPNLQRVPMLARLGSNGSADFSGGISADSVDAVVYCTGYQYTYPFLKRTGLISTGDDSCVDQMMGSCNMQSACRLPLCVSLLLWYFSHKEQVAVG